MSAGLAACTILAHRMLKEKHPLDGTMISVEWLNSLPTAPPVPRAVNLGSRNMNKLINMFDTFCAFFFSVMAIIIVPGAVLLLAILLLGMGDVEATIGLCLLIIMWMRGALIMAK